MPQLCLWREAEDRGLWMKSSLSLCKLGWKGLTWLTLSHHKPSSQVRKSSRAGTWRPWKGAAFWLSQPAFLQGQQPRDGTSHSMLPLPHQSLRSMAAFPHLKLPPFRRVGIRLASALVSIPCILSSPQRSHKATYTFLNSLGYRLIPTIVTTPESNLIIKTTPILIVNVNVFPF